MSRKPGYLNDRHYSEYVGEVEQLFRLKEFNEAEHLLLTLIEVVEQESRATGCGVAPWYYEKLAILYRKQKRKDAEINILERYARQKHAPGSKPPQLIERLQKLKSFDLLLY